MIYQVQSLIMAELSDFPFMEVEYFDSRDEAEAQAKENFKRCDVVYVTVEKITKTSSKTIRSFKK